MEEIVFTKMSVDELKDLITNCVSEALYEQSKITPKQEEETLLTVAELSEYLGVSKVTIHSCGKVNCLSIGWVERCILRNRRY